MIADSPFSSSPWQSDVAAFASNSPIYGLNVDSFNDILTRARNGHELEFDFRELDGEFSVGSSVASSECSADDLYRENEFTSQSDDLFSLCETLGSPLLNSLDSSTEKQEINWGDSDLNSTLRPVPDQNSNMAVSALNALSASQLGVVNQSESVLDNSAQRTWDSLSTGDKLSVVQDLTYIISTQLGLREQLDVIRIINPSATVDPTDTEFAIDLEDISDEKLERIREYMNVQQRNESVSYGSDMSERSTSRSSTPVSDICSDCSVSPAPKKRLSKKQRKEQQKLERQRRKKEMRQIMKEKRSGLFKSEQVLSLSKYSASHDASDDEVDIIT